MCAVRIYLLFFTLLPPPSLQHLELPVSRVLHMFVTFLTADWLIRVHTWFIYIPPQLAYSSCNFFPSVSTVFPHQTFLPSLYIGPHFSSHSEDIESRSSISKRFWNNTPSIQDGSFKAEYLFFWKNIKTFIIIILFCIIWSHYKTKYKKSYIFTFFSSF